MQHAVAERVHAGLQMLPLRAKGERQQQACQSGGNRYETPAAKEAQVTRQADVVKAVVERPGDQAGEDSHRHAELCQFVCLVGVAGELAGAAAELGELIRRDRDEDFGAAGGDQVGDDTREPRRAVVLAREPDRNPDGEQQSQV